VAKATEGGKAENLLDEGESVLRSNDTEAVPQNLRAPVIKSPCSDRGKSMARPLLKGFYRKGANEVVVSDNLRTAGDSNFLARRMMRSAGMLFWVFILFAGCGIPVSRTTVIPKDVAQNPEHLIAKLDLLKTGMESGEVFDL
jgi:hypothetical protein